MIVGQPVPPTDADSDVVLVKSVPEVQTAGRLATPVPVNRLTQFPLTAKHPLERLIPFANVDEAELSETSRTDLRTVVATPPLLEVSKRNNGWAAVDVANENA